ncbi:hypothetical protein BD626DRAFT_507254 [Schizophyllum amplum]|uniref:Uncharacterized protein n=1 Tax=Schizophyllum amplum TaxID=97359 RepID=A0A550C4Q4_9AGAR|nr:hypothetical protein BD626DRAFT_507254 [Auriculariopsis ampla]
MPGLHVLVVKDISCSRRRRARGLVRICLLQELVWREWRQTMPELKRLEILDRDIYLRWTPEAEHALMDVVQSRSAGRGSCDALQEIVLQTPDAQCSQTLCNAHAALSRENIRVVSWVPGLCEDQEGMRSGRTAVAC